MAFCFLKSSMTRFVTFSFPKKSVDKSGDAQYMKTICDFIEIISTPITFFNNVFFKNFLVFYATAALEPRLVPLNGNFQFIPTNCNKNSFTHLLRAVRGRNRKTSMIFNDIPIILKVGKRNIFLRS